MSESGKRGLPLPSCFGCGTVPQRSDNSATKRVFSSLCAVLYAAQSRLSIMK